MQKLRIAFYKAKHGGIDDKVIDKFSGGLGYSHCEVVINKGIMIGAHYLAGGVAKFYYNDIYSSKYWTVLEVDLPAKKAKNFVHSKLGVKYDSLGVVLYFLGMTFGASKDKVWCSELCAEAANEADDTNILDLDTLVMPNDLYKDLVQYYNGVVIQQTKADAELQKPEVDRYGRIGYAKPKS